MEEVARDQGPVLPGWFTVKPSLWLETQECTQPMAVLGRGAGLLDGCWSTTWPLTSGKVLSRPLEVPVTTPPRTTSCCTWCAHAGFCRRLDAEETPGGPVGTWQGLGAEGRALTLSSRSSFPRNPLDAKMGIPGNTVLEVMA